MDSMRGSTIGCGLTMDGFVVLTHEGNLIRKFTLLDLLCLHLGLHVMVLV